MKDDSKVTSWEWGNVNLGLLLVSVLTHDYGMGTL